MKKGSDNIIKAFTSPNTHNIRKSLRQDLVRIMFLLFISLILAIIVNKIHPMGLPIRLTKIKSPGIPIWVWNQLHFTDAQTAFEEVSIGNGILVDVRDMSDYQEGYAQGAISLPYRGFTDYYPAFTNKVSKEDRLFIYCYGSRYSVINILSAKRLLVLGFKNLTIIKGGFMAWVTSGLPIDKKFE